MLKAQVIGNIGGDAEVKQTKSGKDYVSFSVAHDRGKNTAPVWVRVSWFGGVGHPLLAYLKKGCKLHVCGDLSVSTYQDRTGQTVVSVDIYADSVDIVLFPKREDAQVTQQPQANRLPSQNGQAQDNDYFGEHPDDMPF